MEENTNNIPSTEKEKKETASPDLLAARLESLGYQCLSDNGEQFTTRHLVPVDTKKIEEPATPQSGDKKN